MTVIGRGMMLEWAFSAPTLADQMLRFGTLLVLYYLITYAIVWLIAIGLCRMDWLDESNNVYVKVYTGWALALAMHTAASALLFCLFVHWLGERQYHLTLGLFVLPPVLLSALSTLQVVKRATTQMRREISAMTRRRQTNA